MAPENLNLKDIFDYADKIRASIIETKNKKPDAEDRGGSKINLR